MVTLVERRSRYLLVLPLLDATTRTVVAAVTAAFQQLQPTMGRSLTWDRGVEMTSGVTFQLPLTTPTVPATRLGSGPGCLGDSGTSHLAAGPGPADLVRVARVQALITTTTGILTEPQPERAISTRHDSELAPGTAKLMAHSGPGNGQLGTEADYLQFIRYALAFGRGFLRC